MWPALASALAESRPKPLEAPVMTMTCFMTCILFSKIGGAIEFACSDHAAIGAQGLAVDPGAVGAGEEGDAGGDVLGRAETFQRIHFRKTLDQFRRFAFEEQVRRGRARRHRIDGDR